MPRDTGKMSLHTWNQSLDPYNHDQLANNWEILDFHDHSPGRGVQIPAGGIAAGAVGLAQLASNVPLVATGGIIHWGNNTAPSGYLLCDGTAYLQSLYPTLYAVIGAGFANSPASGYFNVPNIASVALAHGTYYTIIKT